MRFLTFSTPPLKIRRTYYQIPIHSASMIVLALIAATLGLWIAMDEAQAHQWPARQIQQDSPLPTSTPDPFATATPDPFATATPDPFATATPDPFATATPDPFATATPDPFATVTAEPFVIPDDSGGQGSPDIAPTPLLLIPPADGAIAPAPVQEPVVPFDLIGAVLRSMADVAVWLWFVCGSLIFFIVAGAVGGFYFSQRERRRYDLYALTPDDHADLYQTELLTEEKRTQAKAKDDDIWPASLP